MAQTKIHKTARKSGGGSGTNQYAMRGAGKPSSGIHVPAPSLMGLAQASPTATKVQASLARTGAVKQWKRKIDAGLSVEEKAAFIDALTGSHKDTSEYGNSAGANAAAITCRYLLQTTEMTPEDIAKLRAAKRVQVRFAAFLSTYVSVEELITDMDSPKPALASVNKLISLIVQKDLQRALAYSKEPNARYAVTMRQALAVAPNTPIEVLDQLASTLPLPVAQNKHASPQLLARLAKLRNNEVQIAVGQHRNTSDEILTYLSNSNTMRVRASVALNAHTPAVVLARLAMHEDVQTLSSVAANPNTPAEVLSQLAQVVHDPVRRSVASNPRSPAKALTLLAKDETLWVRRVVTAHLNTPAKTLTLLAKDKESTVRFIVATRPDAPIAALIKLIGDTDPRVSAAARNNPNLPTHIRAIIALAE